MNFGGLAGWLAASPREVVASDETCSDLAHQAEVAARYVAQHLEERSVALGLVEV